VTRHRHHQGRQPRSRWAAACSSSREGLPGKTWADGTACLLTTPAAGAAALTWRW